MKALRSLIVFLVPLILLFSSCKKTEDIVTTSSSVKLTINKTLVEFDTVFTQMGSATMNFKVKNTNKNAINTNITLAGGSNSYFRINVDGKPGTSFQNKELAGGDSMYVFVEVTVDANNANNPFVIQDSILFNTNGNLQYVKLQAFGQNAIYVMNGNYPPSPLTSTRPYVIMDSFVIPPKTTTTIQKGTKLYFHAGAYIEVRGSLVVTGELSNPVIFQGDRLEHDITYSKGPGQWQGIYLDNISSGSEFSYAIIQNATFGFYDFLNYYNTQPKVKIHNCIIRNMSDFGYVGLNSAMNMDNTLIYNTGKQAFIVDGGTYNIAQCTFDNSNSIFDRQSSTLYVTNQLLTLPDNSTVTAPLSCHFYNVIAYGTLDDEAAADNGGDSAGTGVLFDTLFRGCVLKSKSYTFGGANYVNVDPGYSNLQNEDYHLSVSSYVVVNNNGWTNFFNMPKPNQNLPTSMVGDPDLDGKSWGPRRPGCYTTAK